MSAAFTLTAISLLPDLPLGTAAQAEAACEGQLTVRAGDTLSRIAYRCGTTTEAILRFNPEIRNPNAIQINQMIRLPLDPNAAMKRMEDATTSYMDCLTSNAMEMLQADIIPDFTRAVVERCQENYQTIGNLLLDATGNSEYAAAQARNVRSMAIRSLAVALGSAAAAAAPDTP